MGRRPVKHRRRRWLTLCLPAIVLASSCGSRPTSDAPSPQARAADAGPPFPSPARWALFPTSASVATAALDLGKDGCLVLTEDGQRWLVRARDAAKPCVGTGTASGTPSLDPLRFVERVPGGFRFVADGGAVLTSSEPLGPFSHAARAPSFLVRVAAGGDTVVGIDRAGRTFHFDGGAWRPSSTPSRAPGIDVTVDGSGRALWLGAPEAVLLSSDGGKTFAPPEGGAPATIGAWKTGLTGGALALHGATGSLALEGGRFVRVPGVPSATQGRVAAQDAVIDPARGPRASLVREGTAALTGRRYYEVEPDLQDGGGARWGLLSLDLTGGSPGAPSEPTMTPLRGQSSCDTLRVGASGDRIALACVAPHPSRNDLTLLLDLSTDGGKTFLRVADLRAQTFSDVHLAVAPTGAILVTGACSNDPAPAKAGAAPSPPAKPGAAKEDLAPCAPTGPLLITPGPSKPRVVTGVAAQIQQGSARSPALSPDGRIAYFLARSRRDGRLTLLVSRDGGRTYAPRKLELAFTGWDDEAERDEAPGPSDRVLTIREASTITVDEAGVLGLVCDGARGPVYVTLDSQGRVQSSGRPADSTSQMGGFGGRVLAVGFDDDGSLHAWESLDGAATFSDITVTPALQRFASDEEAVTCSAAACLLGDEVVRIGWEGQAEAPMETPEDTLASAEMSLAPPIVCQMVPRSDWTRIGGRSEDGGSGPRLPRLRDVARGKVAWSILSIQDGGRVDVFSSPMPEKGAPSPVAPSARPLLGAPAAKDLATVVRPQAEGWVALRAPVPRAKGGALDVGAEVEKAELAWQNQYLGVMAKRTVRFEDRWSSLLVSDATLRPALLTVTGSGVTVRLTSQGRAVYFDQHGAAASFDYPPWPELLTDQRGVDLADAAHFGGAPAGIAFLDRNPTARAFAVARPTFTPGAKPTWDVQSLTLGPGHAELEWVYAGDRSGVAATTTTGAHERGDAFLLGDRGLEKTPLPMARLADLGDKLTPCTPDQRRSSVRSVAAHFGRSGALAGTQGRRPVLVTDAPTSQATSLASPILDPVWMLTDGAVLHGTPEQPCVAALKASSVRSGAVAVILGDLDHAWLVRETFEPAPRPASAAAARRPGPRSLRVVSARPMTCKVQQDLSVPAEVLTRSSQRLPDDQP